MSKLHWGKLDGGKMSRIVEVPIEVDSETYDAIVELIGSDEETDVKEFIVKVLTKYAENEGYSDVDEFDFYENG
tara:strand:+ start:381 stop:602 length:222 start_codon:yes stop_codon:yes gene_type:complete